MSDGLFSDDNVPSSSWMKFEKPGNICKGTFVRKYKKEGTGALPDQMVFELVNASAGNAEIGEENKIGKTILEDVGSMNVGIKASNNFILSRLQNIKEGDIIGFAFTHEIAPTKKGMNPAKSIRPFVSPTPDAEYLKNAASDIFDDSDFE